MQKMLFLVLAVTFCLIRTFFFPARASGRDNPLSYCGRFWSRWEHLPHHCLFGDLHHRLGVRYVRSSATKSDFVSYSTVSIRSQNEVSHSHYKLLDFTYVELLILFICGIFILNLHMYITHFSVAQRLFGLQQQFINMPGGNMLEIQIFWQW